MGDGVAAGVQRDVVADDGGAPAQGGSSSSSGEPSTACEQRREGAEGTRKRRRVGESSSVRGDEEFEYSEVADAINKFTEAYVKIETSKIEAKKTIMEHESRLAAVRMEVEERCHKSMLETQLAMAKLVAEAVKGALHRCLDTRDTRDA